MATPPTTSLPPLNPERRRVAVSQFEHANQSVATGNYDYAIRLLLSCCKLDPGNLIYRQTLRRTEKAKYKNNLHGGMLAWLTMWPAKARAKTSLKTRDYLAVLEHGERVLASDPWDVGAQMDMAAAADGLGQLNLAVWLLEQARQKTQTSAAQPRSPASMKSAATSRRPSPCGISCARPSRPIRRPAASSRTWRSTKPSPAATTKKRSPTPRPSRSRTAGADPPSDQEQLKSKEYRVGSAAAKAENALDRRRPPGPEAAPIRAKLQADLTNASLYVQLAAVYRRHNDLDQARAVLQEGLGPTGNAFELTTELADLEIEPFRQNLAVAEERFKDKPTTKSCARSASASARRSTPANWTCTVARPALSNGDEPPLRSRGASAAGGSGR